MIKKQQYVYDALKILVDISRESQIKNKSIFFSMDRKSWAKEFQTIQAGSSRMSGHTQSILNLMIKDKMNIGYFSANNDQRNIFKTNFDTMKKSKSCGDLKFCVTRHSDRCTSFMNNEIFVDLDAIVIDCASFFSMKKIDEIYNISVPKIQKQSFFFILVQ